MIIPERYSRFLGNRVDILVLIFLIFSVLGFSQTLSTQVEKQKVGLGEVDSYILKIDDLQGRRVHISPKNKLLPYHFEVLSDSIEVTKHTYERVVRFQIFEEGTFKIPAIEVIVGDESLMTIPYEIHAENTAHPNEEINDIMANKSVSLDILDYLEIYKWYILVVLLAIGVVILVVYFIKYGKKQLSEPVRNTNITLKKLEALGSKNYIKQEDFRAFYVELLDILRDFLIRQYQISADVLLTDDLIDFMKESSSISNENEVVISSIFQRGDRVKFAKIYPNSTTMQNDFDDTKRIVKNSVKDIEFENLRKS